MTTNCTDCKIVLIGCVESSRVCLEEIADHVVGIITRKDTGYHVDYADLTPIAYKHHIPIHYTGNINDSAETIKAMKPDYIFVFGWSQLIGPEIQSIAPCIGLHPTLLPIGRGRHPLVWTLIKKVRISGLTFFWIDDGLPDSGDILWQRIFYIDKDETPKTIYRKVTNLCRSAMLDIMRDLLCGRAQRLPQDHSKATYYRKRTKEEMEAFKYDPI